VGRQWISPRTLAITNYTIKSNTGKEKLGVFHIREHTTWSFHIKSIRKTCIHNLTHSEMIHCGTAALVETSITANFYCVMATRILRADIQNQQKKSVFQAQVFKWHNFCPN
jgi:hypothetical protein